MTDLDFFTASSKLFNEQKFQEGLKQIQRCIQQNPKSSLLYSNRSLFLVGLGNVGQAIKDLKLAISLNHLNYIAYFNLFSLYIRQNNTEQALHEIYCALSAIYLLAAKQLKSYEYVSKAVLYAKNNIEGRVLKGLMQMEQGNFKDAHQQLVWACGIQTDNNLLAKVRDLIKKIGDSSQERNPQQNSQSTKNKNQIRRLQSSIDLTKIVDLQLQIKEKIIQFCNVYQLYGNLQGISTQKIGQELKNRQLFIRQKVGAKHQKNEQHLTNEHIKTASKEQIPNAYENTLETPQIIQTKFLQMVQNLNMDNLNNAPEVNEVQNMQTSPQNAQQIHEQKETQKLEPGYYKYEENQQISAIQQAQSSSVQQQCPIFQPIVYEEFKSVPYTQIQTEENQPTVTVRQQIPEVQEVVILQSPNIVLQTGPTEENIESLQNAKPDDQNIEIINQINQQSPVILQSCPIGAQCNAQSPNKTISIHDSKNTRNEQHHEVVIQPYVVTERENILLFTDMVSQNFAKLENHPENHTYQ